MSPWATLGIEPTDDVAEIRRAYARKLKAIDVDADPGAFIALREALNDAQFRARYGEPPDVSDDLGLLDDLELLPSGDFAVEPVLPVSSAYLPDASEYLPDSTLDPAGEARRERLTSLDRMLFPGEDAPPPNPDELAAAVRAIIDDPEMAHVDHAARVEDWLAGALCDSIPRSDPVIPMVVLHFGWMEELDLVHGRPLVSMVAQRADDLACVDCLRSPDHRWHDAYCRLAGAAPAQLSLKDKLNHRQSVGQLLESLRQHNPGAEDFLDPNHVALWDREISGRRRTHPGGEERISWYAWLAMGWVVLFSASILDSLV